MKGVEKLIFYTNKSSILLVFRILFGIIFFDIILIITFSIVDYVSLDKYIFFYNYSFEEHIIIIFLFIHIILFLYLFIIWFFDYYKICNQKVEHITGIFLKKKQLYIIEKLDSISIYQSFLGRLLHYGNISFFYNEKEITLRHIPYPEEFVKFIEFLKGVNG